jgi:general stress protein 26
MSSINQNQPEENHQDLQGQEAVAKIKEIVDIAKACFFCTKAATGESIGARPMNVRKVDDKGNLWFLSADDSRINNEIALNPYVTLYFQGSPHSDFVQLNGRATISRDQEKIKELWEAIKTWFTEGVNDSRITVVKVIPSVGYYWDNKHGNMVAGVKILIGAAIGKTLDDSIEGSLKV